MIPDDIRMLLGGYATGSLTDAERNRLYSAALENQELFDALADEEVLRQLLAEPGTREALLEELQRQPQHLPWQGDEHGHANPVPMPMAAYAAPRAELPGVATSRPDGVITWWNRYTPAQLAVAGALFAAVLAVVGVQYSRTKQPVEIAMNKQPLPEAQPPTPASVAQKATELKNSAQAASRKATESAPDAVPIAQQPAVRDERADAEAAELRKQEALQNQIARTLEVPAPFATPQENRQAASATREAKSADAAGQAKEAEQDRLAKASPGVGAGVSGLPAALGNRISVTTPSQIVAGGLRPAPPPARAAAPPPASSGGPGAAASRILEPLDAKVTDVNGTIVSITAGANSGLRSGDIVEIVRDNRVIATVKLAQIGPAFSVGPFERAAGSAEIPRSGDIVRRPPQ